MNSTVVLFVLALWYDVAVCFKPVILMHGILARADELLDMENLILKAHPATEILRIQDYDGALSVLPMWTQVHKIAQEVKDFMEKHPDGVHMLGFSQGGLVSRALLETMDHNVDTFISLSAPQGGQFGITDIIQDLLPVKIGNYTKEELYKVFYTEDGQYISVGGYWYDPHHLNMFCDSSLDVFLATLNNQTYNKYSIEFKKNFLKLKKLVMIGGPDDNVITPWQSSHFAAYNENEEVIEYQKQQWYIEDPFGLQTMSKNGQVHTYTIPGVYHTHWHGNATVFECCILPWLT